MNAKTAIGIGLVAIAEEHIFTFMLSSCMTGRTIVKEKGQVEEVKKDLLISVGLSMAIGLIIAGALKDRTVTIFAVAFSILLYAIYTWRAEIPW